MFVSSQRPIAIPEHEVQQGRFRQDLFFRLGRGPRDAASPRDRRTRDPIAFATVFAPRRRSFGAIWFRVFDGALTLLLSHTWPGNIRELRNFCDYLAATSSDGIITSKKCRRFCGKSPATETSPTPAVADPHWTFSPNPTFRSLEDEIRELEQRRMMEALTAQVQVRAAELLGMPIRTFSYKMKQYGISATGKSTKQGIALVSQSAARSNLSLRGEQIGATSRVPSGFVLSLERTCR